MKTDVEHEQEMGMIRILRGDINRIEKEVWSIDWALG